MNSTRRVSWGSGNIFFTLLRKEKSHRIASGNLDRQENQLSNSAEARGCQSLVPPASRNKERAANIRSSQRGSDAHGALGHIALEGTPDQNATNAGSRRLGLGTTRDSLENDKKLTLGLFNGAVPTAFCGNNRFPRQTIKLEPISSRTQDQGVWTTTPCSKKTREAF